MRTVSGGAENFRVDPNRPWYNKQDARVHELMYRCQGLAQNVMEVFRMPFEWHLTAIAYHSNAIDQHRMSFGTFDDIECHAMYEDIPIPFNDM